MTGVSYQVADSELAQAQNVQNVILIHWGTYNIHCKKFSRLNMKIESEYHDVCDRWGCGKNMQMWGEWPNRLCLQYTIQSIYSGHWWFHNSCKLSHPCSEVVHLLAEVRVLLHNLSNVCSQLLTQQVLWEQHDKIFPSQNAVAATHRRSRWQSC